MAEIKAVGSGRGFKQALDDLSAQDRRLDAENQVSQAQPFVKKVWDLGNSSGTYVDWKVFSLHDGYSIWAFPQPADWHTNANNVLYQSNQRGHTTFALEYRGAALATSNVVFDGVATFSGTAVTDHTAEAETDLGTAFTTIETLHDVTQVDNYLYVGTSGGATLTPFQGVAFTMRTAGAGHRIYAEFFNGTDWTSGTTPIIKRDNTNNWTRNGVIELQVPLSEWGTIKIATLPGTFVRFASTTVPQRQASFYSIRPASGVADLLARSSEQLLNRRLAWTEFDPHIYMTVLNNGSPTREGLDYIKSGSNQALIRQFFVGVQRHKVAGAIPSDFRIPAFQSGSAAFQTWILSGSSVEMSETAQVASLCIVAGTQNPLLATRSGGEIRMANMSSTIVY